MSNFPLTQLPAEQFFFGLFVGSSGSGKTSAAASFPHPICVIDIDKRAKGINGCRWVQKEGIDVEWFKGDDILLELEALFTKWEIEINARKFKYKTIIFDGFTSLASLMIENSFELTSKMAKGGDSNRKSQGHPKIGTVDLPGFDEFSYEHGGFRNVMNFLKYGLKCNVICTAHWVDAYSADGKPEGKRINLRPRVLPNVEIWFDEVYYFEKSEATKAVVGVGPVKYNKHKVEFRSSLARTTVPELPQEMDITEKNFYEEWQKVLPKKEEVGGK